MPADRLYARPAATKRFRPVIRLPDNETSLLSSPHTAQQASAGRRRGQAARANSVLAFVCVPGCFTRPTGVLDTQLQLQPTRRNQCAPVLQRATSMITDGYAGCKGGVDGGLWVVDGGSSECRPAGVAITSAMKIGEWEFLVALFLAGPGGGGWWLLRRRCPPSAVWLFSQAQSRDSVPKPWEGRVALANFVANHAIEPWLPQGRHTRQSLFWGRNPLCLQPLSSAESPVARGTHGASSR